MSLDDVAKVTKIQLRILERLEAGQLDGLPAEVFVRGFVRSVARCVGLDESEALRRYAACVPGPMATGSVDIAPTARALVDAMADLAPRNATGANGASAANGVRATPRKMLAVSVIAGEPDGLAGGMPMLDLAAGSLGGLPASPVEPVKLPETGGAVSPSPATPVAEASSDLATSAEGAAPAVVVAAVAVAAGDAVPSAPAITAAACASPQMEGATPSAAVDPAALAHVDDELEPPPPTVEAAATQIAATQTPVAPAPPGKVAAAQAPAPQGSKKRRGRRAKARDRRKAHAASVGATPSLDEALATAPWAPRMPPLGAAPSVPWRKPAYAATPAAVVPRLVIDDADPDSAERALEERAETHAPRRSFLPPILQDREDRSARQGGLTLAVIILLIAATLTLSYLMRRPSASGDGVTRLEAPSGERTPPSREPPSSPGNRPGLGLPARG